MTRGDLVLMQKRILILGKTGMLGHMVEYVLTSDQRFAVRGVGRAEFDVAQCEHGTRGKTSGVEAGGRTPEVEEARSAGKTSGVKEPAPMLRSARLDAFLRDVDYVINCIGITARHINESDSTSVARAIHVNAEFPHALAAAAGARGIRVIHMSTDGVFSGSSDSPYTEDAVPDATDTYGRTKSLGESAAPNVLNIRCSIIGPSPIKHEGLWEWVAAQPDGATVDGYTNHLWHGATTRQFAEFCQRVMIEDRFDALRANGHVLHFAPNTPVSKAELVQRIAEALGKRITVRSATHAQPIRRVLAMRSNAVHALGASQRFAEALRACATVCT